MNAQEALAEIETLAVATPTAPFAVGVLWTAHDGKKCRWTGTEWEPVVQECAASHATGSYAQLKGADALAHLNEQLAAEIERYERDCGLRVASIKVTRVRDTDDLRAIKAHVR